MFQVSGRVLGCLAALSLLAPQSLAAYADAPGLPPFTTADLAQQRDVFKALLSGISDYMTRSDFEAIIGRKLTTDSLGNDAGAGGHSDLYRIVYSYDKYFYGFNYAEVYRGPSHTFHIMGLFDQLKNMITDDATCLSLTNIKNYADAGGWKVDPPFAEWLSHGITATKGRLQLKATANGGVGEPGMPGEEYHVWISKYGLTGCVSDLRIEQMA